MPTRPPFCLGVGAGLARMGRYHLWWSQHLTAGGCNVAQIEVEEHDHFDVIYDLITPATPLGDATLQLLLK